MDTGVLLFIVIGIPLAFAVMAGIFILALKLGTIVYKAMEKPEPGDSTRYRLDQGREVDDR